MCGDEPTNYGGIQGNASSEDAGGQAAWEITRSEERREVARLPTDDIAILMGEPGIIFHIN